MLRDKYNQFHRQYDLFEGFIVMAVESGTAENSVSNLIDIFQKLLNDGWCIRRKVDELKSIFVSTVMGDFLKCFKCDNCGASFIVNKEPHNKFVNNYYQCPSCHNSRMVKGDDTFINALVTEEQRENIVHVEGLRKELEILRPFKILLDTPCEICCQPIADWSELNLKAGIKGLGWAHNACWNNPAGQFKLFTIAYKGVIEKRGY